jgi:hypothetical protein
MSTRTKKRKVDFSPLLIPSFNLNSSVSTDTQTDEKQKEEAVKIDYDAYEESDIDYLKKIKSKSIVLYRFESIVFFDNMRSNRFYFLRNYTYIRFSRFGFIIVSISIQ